MNSEQPLPMTSRNTDLGLHRCSTNNFYIIKLSGESWLYINTPDGYCAELYVFSLINALDTEVLV